MEPMQIDKICRACLREDVEMIDTSENDVYQKFLLFANLTAEEELLNIPFNLCRSCEQKINISSLDFKEQCQTSHDILLNRVRNARNVKLEAVDVDAKKSWRLEQFPEEEVSAVINELKQRFYKNTHCIKCSYVGNHSRGLALHVSRMHLNLKSRWCCECNAEVDDLNAHAATNHNDDYVCKFCGKRYVVRSQLTEHLRCHSDARPFRCPFCERCFVKQTLLNTHLNDHTRGKLYKCDLCDDSFYRLYHLKQHLKTHKSGDDAEEQFFVAGQKFCVECNKNVRSLVTHKEQVHASVDDEHIGKLFHKCKYCNKTFGASGKLVMHERIHTGEKPYACQVCGRRFSTSNSRKYHMKLHNIGAKISCEICDKKFSRSHDYRLHLRKHTGEKPYVCAECGKAFIRQHHLKVHLKLHGNVRPHQCSCCDKSFVTSWRLKRHMWIHSGEKPFKCSQCSFACRDSFILSVHMKRHKVDKPQAGNPHACLMCNRTFSTQAMLTNHVNTHQVSFLDI